MIRAPFSPVPVVGLLPHVCRVVVVARFDIRLALTFLVSMIVTSPVGFEHLIKVLGVSFW
jgi:hypothetical protein